MAWNFFAFFNASMTIASSLLNCTSMPSNALSRLNQKLTACDAVTDETSLMSLVATWMALIHGSTCDWRKLGNVLSVRSFDGMWETLSRWPRDWAFLYVSQRDVIATGRENPLTQQPVE